MRFLGLGKPAAPRRGRARRKQPGREPARAWRRRARLAGALAIVGLVAGASWLVHSGWVGRQVDRATQEILAATGRAGLQVEEVLVEGRARTARSAILAALGVERGTPILALSPSAAKARLEALPWVREAAVTRRLPGVVAVALVERTPLALWRYKGRLAVIDRRGKIVPGARPMDFATLPLLAGAGAARHALDLVTMLNREPTLGRRVTAAVRLRDRRWNVTLDQGIDIILPEENADAAWAELARIQRKHGVLDRGVIAIDLRMPDRLIVRTAPDTAPARRAAGKDT